MVDADYAVSVAKTRESFETIKMETLGEFPNLMNPHEEA
jgi:hypothetical protein